MLLPRTGAGAPSGGGADRAQGVRDCTFAWENGNGGKSLGKTLPAIPTAVERVYAPVPCTAESAAAIPCTQVLGAYTVIFDRCAG